MNDSHRAQLERGLLAERGRLQEMLFGLGSQARDTTVDHGRFRDDAMASSVGVRAEDDRALSVHTTRELAEIDRALDRMHDDPEHFGICATCARPIPFERLRLVPGTRHCRAHAPQ
jgi:RNA polymerase-binding transcription factor DksA